VMLLISWQHISSVISLQAWMISALNSIIVCGFFGKIFKECPKKIVAWV
jgi:hypothetical protein